jgi:hypothetical protein
MSALRQRAAPEGRFSKGEQAGFGRRAGVESAPMRHVAITALCVLFLACKKDEPPDARQAAVRVEVSFNFKAGCIAVLARDKENPEVNKDSGTVQVWDREASNRKVTVAVFRKDNWGRTLEVITTAHERDCEGKEVVRDLREVTLDTPGTKTLAFSLSAQDGDGDGYIPTANGGTDCDDANGAVSQRTYYRDGDSDGFGAGAAVLGCTQPAGHVTNNTDCNDANGAVSPSATEVCNDIDDNCDGALDEGFEKQWYLDDDGDTFGRIETAMVSCMRPSAKHVNRTGDCQDGLADVYPTALEKCNNRDDNCNDIADDPFITGLEAKGNDCTTLPADGSCAGKFECNALQNGTFCKAPERVKYYPDADRDGEGAKGGDEQLACVEAPVPNGTVSNDMDCDDAEPTTKTVGATEVCDAIDNNCSGQADEGLSCGGTFRRVYTVLGGDGHDWQTVAVGPNGLPVWVAGLGGKLAVRKTRVGAFQGFSYGAGPPADPPDPNNCGDHDWYAAWVNPATNNVFLAGENMRVAEHDGSSCIRGVTVNVGGTTSQPFTSIVGIGNPLTLFLVSQEGRLHMWEVGTAGANPVQLHNSIGYYRGVYALSPQLLYAVGTVDETAPLDPVIYEHTSANWNSPMAMPFTGTEGYNGSLQAIWMDSASQAYAVGDDGLVMKKEGSTSTWARVPAPPGATPDFTSVGMPPGSDTAYIVDKGAPGKLWKRTPFGWAVPPVLSQVIGSGELDVPLNDIAVTTLPMTTPPGIEFWVVGNDGRVYHFPE